MPIGRIILFAILLTAGTAPRYSVRLDAGQCAAMSDRDMAALARDWMPWRRYVQRCRVPGPDGRVALLIDIVRLDRALDEPAASRPATGAPLPAIRLPAGRVVGHLPEGFPADPPGELRVRFTTWRGDIPLVIALFEGGESALAPHPLAPLRWNGRSRAYQ